MKDFYKILGVEENASEEEIRERWIELTKQYHPDRGEGSTSDEKIREINEAYQVLKHSSTRVEYDLKRTFNHRNRRRKRTVHFKRWGVPASILIILIILGVIYMRNFETNQTNQASQTNQRNEINKIDQRSQISKRNQINEKDQIDQINQKDQTNLSRLPRSEPARGEMRSSFHRDEINEKDQINQRNQINKRNQTNERDQRNRKDQKDVVNPITSSVAGAATIKKVQLPEPPQTPITRLRDDVVANKPSSSVNQRDQRNLSRLPGSESVQGEMQSLFHWDQINQTDQKNQTSLNIEVAQFKAPSLLATEAEVKTFFNDYANCYNRKDAKGILSLFSSKAIQNQKDGPEEIGKMHVDFFSEGQDIRYSLHDMKIEIYQNAVEVKARYEIEQIVKETGEKEAWRGPIRWVLIKEDGKLKILSMDYKYHRPL